MEKKVMQYTESEHAPFRKYAVSARLLGGLALLLCTAGCGSGTKTSVTTPTAPIQGPQSYFAPYIVGTTNGASSSPGLSQIYAIDDSAATFSQSTFQLQLPQQQGPQVINVGGITPAQRGLLSLGIKTNYIPSNATRLYSPTNYDPPKTGSFAVELAGQAGGLVQLVGQPAEPLVAAVQCPNLKSAQTYQFVTLPAPLIDSSSTGLVPYTWDPKLEAAYGNVDISSDGNNVTFDNIRQSTLPSTGGTGVPLQQPSSPQMGVCGSTVLGSTISVPGLPVVQDPGSFTSPSPQDTIGIGPTGLLVETTGDHIGADSASPVRLYPPVLGSGSGVVGLPKSSSALDTTALRGAQYLGFIYGAGMFGGASTWSSHLSSFGFAGYPTLPSACSTFAAQTGQLGNGIYGGDFPQNNGQDDPSASPGGFGNCDLAIDLGTQDPSNNGLFPKATIWLGGSYAANTTGKTYSFSAVAIAGQLNGKNAIFVLGVDSTQPWAIYLLQSN